VSSAARDAGSVMTRVRPARACASSCVLAASVLWALAGSARAEGLRFEEGRLAEADLVRLEVDPSQRAALDALARTEDEYVQQDDGSVRRTSVELALTTAQQDALERSTGRRVTWLDAGYAPRFIGECTCDDFNLAHVEGDHLVVPARLLDASRLSYAEGDAHVARGSFVPKKYVGGVGSVSCEFPDGTPDPVTPAGFAATTSLSLSPERRDSLRRLLEGFELGPTTPLPGSPFRPVSLQAPRIPDDMEDNGFLGWIGAFGGPSGVRANVAGGPGLDARERSDRDFRVFVVHDAERLLDPHLRRVARVLVYRGPAPVLFLTHDGTTLSCRAAEAELPPEPDKKTRRTPAPPAPIAPIAPPPDTPPFSAPTATGSGASGGL